MSEPSPASEWAPPPRRSFSTLVTVVCSIVAILYIGLLGRPLIEPRVSPLAELEHPAESLERLVTRELDLRAAMRGGPRWEWRLYRALSGDEDPLAAAGDWYAELVEQTDSPFAELHRAIILAEAGRMAQAREAIAELAAGPGPRERMAAWATAAYVGPRPAADAGRALIAEIDDLPATWFTDTLIRRIATRIGDTEARAQAEAATLARGRALLLRARGLMAVSLALLAAGGIALVWMVARRRSVRVASAPAPPGLELRRRLCALRARPRRAAGHRARGLHRAPTGNGVRHRARHGGGPAALLVGDPLPPPAGHVDAGDLRPRAAPRGLGAAPRRDARAHRRGARERHPHRAWRAASSTSRPTGRMASPRNCSGPAAGG